MFSLLMCFVAFTMVAVIWQSFAALAIAVLMFPLILVLTTIRARQSDFPVRDDLPDGLEYKFGMPSSQQIIAARLLTRHPSKKVTFADGHVSLGSARVSWVSRYGNITFAKEEDEAMYMLENES